MEIHTTSLNQRAGVEDSRSIEEVVADIYGPRTTSRRSSGWFEKKSS